MERVCEGFNIELMKRVPDVVVEGGGVKAA